MLYFCEYSLHFFKRRSQMLRHMAKCPVRHPPGNEIYRHENVCMFEVCWGGAGPGAGGQRDRRGGASQSGMHARACCCRRVDHMCVCGSYMRVCVGWAAGGRGVEGGIRRPALDPRKRPRPPFQGPHPPLALILVLLPLLPWTTTRQVDGR